MPATVTATPNPVLISASQTTGKTTLTGVPVEQGLMCRYGKGASALYQNNVGHYRQRLDRCEWEGQVK